MRGEDTGATGVPNPTVTRRLPDEGPRRRKQDGSLDARRMALADLMRSPALGKGDIRRAVRQITETAARLIDVERTSVWRLVDGGSALECTDLYERSPGRHSAGLRIQAADAPRYFAALQLERAIRAHDARTDKRTSEFRAAYLDPLGITAMLDAPVMLRGKMVGVVCHEHIGSPRRWRPSEELLAGTFADFVALVMEAASWNDAQQALREERDALERKVEERTRALSESESSLRALIDFSPVAMVLTSAADQRVLLVNRRAAALLEMTIDTIEGQSVPDYWVSVRDKTRFLEHLRRRGRVDDMETELRSQSGRVFWARVSAQRLRFAGEDALLGALVDITDQRRAQDRLRELATRDSLTDVYNRRHLEEIARKELARSERNGRPLTMAMLDVDHFKQINDTYGHQVGDEVLCEIARRFAKSIRASDILGRYGGEEFVVIFPETNLEEARVVSERLLTAVAGQPIAAGRGAISVTVSIGLTTFVSGQDMERVIERADAALYVAKANGRNQVRVGDADVPGRTPTPVLVDRRSGSHRPS